MEINESSVVNSALQRTSAENQQRSSQVEQTKNIQAEDQSKSADLEKSYATSATNDPEAVQGAVEKLSEFVETVSNRGLQISVDKDLSQVVLKVVNKDNEETIRQIPTEEVLELMKRMRDLSEEFFGDATGLLVENKA